MKMKVERASVERENFLLSRPLQFNIDIVLSQIASVSALLYARSAFSERRFWMNSIQRASHLLGHFQNGVLIFRPSGFGEAR